MTKCKEMYRNKVNKNKCVNKNMLIKINMLNISFLRIKLIFHINNDILIIYTEN